MRTAMLVATCAAALGFCVAAAVATGQAPAPLRIGVVDQERILNESAEGKRLNGELQKLRASKMTAIDAKEKEITALQDQMIHAQPNLGDDKREDLNRQLKRKRVEYERLNDDATAEFQEAGGRAQAKLISIFRDIVAKYGAEKGFTIVVEKGTLYFASPSVEVTDEVLAKFNAAAPAGSTQPKSK